MQVSSLNNIKEQNTDIFFGSILQINLYYLLDKSMGELLEYYICIISLVLASILDFFFFNLP